MANKSSSPPDLTKQIPSGVTRYESHGMVLLKCVSHLHGQWMHLRTLAYIGAHGACDGVAEREVSDAFRKLETELAEYLHGVLSLLNFTDERYAYAVSESDGPECYTSPDDMVVYLDAAKKTEAAWDKRHPSRGEVNDA